MQIGAVPEGASDRPPSLFQKGKKASSIHRSYQIGFEIYYFSNRAEMSHSRGLLFATAATDRPVSMVRFRPTATSPPPLRDRDYTSPPTRVRRVLTSRSSTKTDAPAWN